jgi:SRSO17 transposase
VTAPAETSVQHQRLLHFVADAPWADEPVLAKVRELLSFGIDVRRARCKCDSGLF